MLKEEKQNTCGKSPFPSQCWLGVFGGWFCVGVSATRLILLAPSGKQFLESHDEREEPLESYIRALVVFSRANDSGLLTWTPSPAVFPLHTYCVSHIHTHARMHSSSYEEEDGSMQLGNVFSLTLENTKDMQVHFQNLGLVVEGPGPPSAPLLTHRSCARKLRKMDSASPLHLMRN